jgi:O-antigen ligase
LINTFKNKLYSYYKNIFFYIFISFYIYLVLNSLINNFNLDSLKISIFYFRFGIFSIAVWYILNKKEFFLKYLFYCFVVCFVFLILDSYYQYFIGENIFGFKIDAGTNRPSSLFGAELILGSYLSRLYGIFFGLAIYLYNFNKDRNYFYFLGLLFVLLESLIFVSGERVAFFYLNLSSIFVILLIKDYKIYRIVIMAIAIVLVSVVSLVNDNAKKRIIDQTITQMNIKGDDGVKIFSQQHQNHYISAYKMFRDNMVLGVGVKNFRNYCNVEKYKIDEASCTTHPHNTYIQILSETGIIGFLFIMIALIMFIYNISRHFLLSLNNKNYFTGFEICILSTISITLWPFIPTGNFFNNWLSIIFYFPIGLLLFSLNKKNKTI